MSFKTKEEALDYQRNYRKKKGSEQVKSDHRRWRLPYVYGITVEQFAELSEQQEHKCAICLRHRDEFTTHFHIDHNHKTGEIRGLLCGYCNRRFLGRHSDPDKFERAAVYLRKGTGWFVPPKKKRKKRARKRK